MSALAMLRSVFGSRAEGAAHASAIDNATAVIADLDHSLTHVDNVDAGLAVREGNSAADEKQLLAERDRLLDLAADGDAEAEATLAGMSARLDAVKSERVNVADMRRRQAIKRSGLSEQRATAVQQLNEAELRQAALDLLDAGKDTDAAFVVAAEKLARFVEADTKATQLAHRLGEPEGRWLGDRIGDAMSCYFIPYLWRLTGTDVLLNFTASKRGVSFITASRRPFTPPEDKEGHE